MNRLFCYNTNMDFDSIKFRDFIRDKFAEWRGKGRSSLVDFAAYIGVSQQNMSNWYNGNFKRRPEAESFILLINKYGVEVYDILDIPRPSVSEVLSRLSPSEAEDVTHALAEIKSSGLYNANANASPEDVEKIKDILVKHLGKYQETEH